MAVEEEAEATTTTHAVEEEEATINAAATATAPGHTEATANPEEVVELALGTSNNPPTEHQQPARNLLPPRKPLPWIQLLFRLGANTTLPTRRRTRMRRMEDMRW